jgi:hypothetical protein
MWWISRAPLWQAHWLSGGTVNFQGLCPLGTQDYFDKIRIAWHYTRYCTIQYLCISKGKTRCQICPFWTKLWKAITRNRSSIWAEIYCGNIFWLALSEIYQNSLGDWPVDRDWRVVHASSSQTSCKKGPLQQFLPQRIYQQIWCINRENYQQLGHINRKCILAERAYRQNGHINRLVILILMTYYRFSK